MASLLKIPETIALIQRSWQTAESQVRKAVREKFWEADEEFITRMLVGELRAEFKSLNANKKLERAFSNDLARFDRNFKALADGLVAEVTYHKKNIEAETGGDFGLLLVRPDFASRFYKRPTMRQQGYLFRPRSKEIVESWGN